jgi:hypothetical protein
VGNDREIRNESGHFGWFSHGMPSANDARVACLAAGNPAGFDHRWSAVRT